MSATNEHANGHAGAHAAADPTAALVADARQRIAAQAAAGGPAEMPPPVGADVVAWPIAQVDAVAARLALAAAWGELLAAGANLPPAAARQEALQAVRAGRRAVEAARLAAGEDPDAAERERFWFELSAEEREARRLDLWGDPAVRRIAQAGDVIGLLRQDIAQVVVGEMTLRAALLTFLCCVSRLLPAEADDGARPCVVMVGTSAAGKTFPLKIAARFTPAGAVLSITASSARALAYGEEPLKHRVIVMPEASSLTARPEASEGAALQVALLRSLLSEGCIDYEVVEKDQNGRQVTRKIRREGPTVLLAATSAARLDPDTQTRALIVAGDDGTETTREIVERIAERFERPAAAAAAWDVASQWRRFGEWLEVAEHRVVVPFASVIAKRIGALPLRLRRDAPAVLMLVQAAAILQQANRRRDADGRVLAELHDYEVVRQMLAEALNAVAGGTPSAATREVLAALDAALAAHGEAAAPSAWDGGGATRAEIAAQLNPPLDDEALRKRIIRAQAGGWIANVAGERQVGRYRRVAARALNGREVLPALTEEDILSCGGVAW